MKNLPVEYKFVHILKNEQSSNEQKAINPSASVPVLIRLDADQSFPIGQSMAALEYLEEAFPDRVPLLPPASDVLARAKVRTLANIIACDIQPVTNLRVVNAVAELGGDKGKWMKEWMQRGFEAFEATVKNTAGFYCVGDQITLADICLVPAVWGAERFGVDMKGFPTSNKIYLELMKHEAVRAAHWQRQPDTPEDLR
jgi:maleylacetoacetate isomerase